MLNFAWILFEVSGDKKGSWAVFSCVHCEEVERPGAAGLQWKTSIKQIELLTEKIHFSLRIKKVSKQTWQIFFFTYSLQRSIRNINLRSQKKKWKHIRITSVYCPLLWSLKLVQLQYDGRHRGEDGDMLKPKLWLKLWRVDWYIFGLNYKKKSYIALVKENSKLITFKTFCFRWFEVRTVWKNEQHRPLVIEKYTFELNNVSVHLKEVKKELSV